MSPLTRQQGQGQGETTTNGEVFLLFQVILKLNKDTSPAVSRPKRHENTKAFARRTSREAV